VPRSTLRSSLPTLPRPRVSAVQPALVQLSSLLVVAAVGAGVLAVTASTTATRPVAASASAQAHSVRHLDTGDLTPPTRSDRHEALPRTPAPAHHKSHSKAAKAKKKPLVRWVPTGTGIWIYQWHRSNGGNPGKVVKRAQDAHLTTLYVRTGSSHDGFTGEHVLRSLLPATKGTSLRVVAWDFPELRHPKHDAKRMSQAAWYMRKSGARVAAVAPDIETRAEGTHLSPAHVNLYLKTLRAMLPKDVAILATVPWPSRFRVGRYPYDEVAFRSDAMLPMAYWYDNSPVDVTAKSIRYLARFHRPVLPVGQGYDGRLDVPSLPHNNLKKQVPAFIATAHRFGARGVSLWSWEAAPKNVWHALKWAHRLFPAKH
jgi:hypothetical protein